MEGGASSSSGPAQEPTSRSVLDRRSVHRAAQPAHGILHQHSPRPHSPRGQHPHFAGSMMDLDDGAKPVARAASPRGSRIAGMVGDINKKEDTRKSMASVRQNQAGGLQSPRGSVATARSAAVNHGRASMASHAMSMRGSVAPMAVPLITSEASDMLLHELEAALHRLDACQGSAVRLIKAELEMLTLFERFALLTDGAMRSQKGEAVEIFGNESNRLTRARAVVESTDFSEANKKDRRINDLTKKMTAMEALIAEYGAQRKSPRGQECSKRMIARQKAVLDEKRSAITRFRSAGWVARVMAGLVHGVSGTTDEENAEESASPDFAEPNSRIIVDKTSGQDKGDDPFLLSDKESDSDSDEELPQEKWAENELGVDVQAAAPESLMLMIPPGKGEQYDAAVRAGQDSSDDNIWGQYFNLIFVQGDED